VVAVILVLFAGLVLLLVPGRFRFRPAALVKYPPGCIKIQRRFVPTNVTDLSDPAIDSLPAQKRDRVLLQANMRACTCGCNLSVMSCRLSYPQCEASKNMLRRDVAGTSGQ
jgi:hypothetical protein